MTQQHLKVDTNAIIILETISAAKKAGFKTWNYSAGAGFYIVSGESIAQFMKK